MNENKSKNYWDIPRFILGLKISNDAKIIYGLLSNMEKEKAIKLSGLSEKKTSIVLKELETEKLIINGKLQDEEEYRLNKSIF